MTTSKLMRFVLWAQRHRDEGRGLSIEAVMQYAECSRAQAYRILADYFDARAWQWPRPRDPGMQVKFPKLQGRHPWKERAVA